MPEAAFLTNDIEHSFALAGLVAGLLIGAAIAAATVATGGAALAIAVAGGAALGASVGELIGKLVPGITTGKLSAKSITVLINRKPAANTNTQATCSGPPGSRPHPGTLVAQGSSTVIIENAPAARKGDKLTCGAVIAKGSANVFIGGETVQVREVDSEVPGWLHGVVLVLGLASGVGALARLGVCATGIIIRLGSAAAGGMLGGMGGGWLGGKIFGEGSKGQMVSEFLGGMVGGGLGFKAGAKFSKSTTAQKLGLGDPVDVATGEVFDAMVDFNMNGLVAVEWKRNYLSSRWKKGLLGYGWHLCYEQYIDEAADGEFLLWCDNEGRDVFLERTDIFSAYFDSREKIKLEHQHNRYIIHNYENNLYYHFTKSAFSETRYVLTQIENVVGVGLRLHWGYDNRLESITETHGKKIRIVYNKENCIIKVYTEQSPSKSFINKQGSLENIHSNSLITYEYDELQNMALVTNAAGKNIAMRYNQHLIIAKTDMNGHTFNWEYDKIKSDARCIHVYGEKNYINNYFSYHGNTTLFTNALGFQSRYEHNGRGLVTKIIDAEGGSEQWEYDDNNNTVLYINALGQTTKNIFTVAGTLQQIEYADGGLQMFTYDAQYRLIGSTNIHGQPNTFSYNEAGLLKTRTLADGNAVLYRYDERGRLLTTLDSVLGETTISYDDNDNITIIKDAHGREELRRYNDRNLCTVLERGEFRENYGYDELGRVGIISNTKGEDLRLSYNGNDKVVRVADTKNKLLLDYTPLGLLKKREHNGAVLRFTYNSEDWLTKITNEKGENYLFAYNKNGELVAETGFDGKPTRYLRNKAGVVQQVTKANGKTTKYQYNNKQLLERIEYSPDYWEAFEYDDRNDLVKASNPFSEVVLELDSLGRVCGEIYNWGEVAFENTYNQFGSLSASKSNLGYAQQWQHNTLGHLQKTSTKNDNTDWTAQYKHDLYGFELEKMLPGDIQVKWLRDATGRPLAQTLKQGHKLHAQYNYRWNAADQLEAKQDHLSGTITNYQYNEAGYLTRSTVNSSDPMKFRADMQHRVADEVGNLYETSSKVDRKYGAGGQLLQKGHWSYRYDACGNLIEKVNSSSSEIWFYSWYANDMLKSVRRNGQAAIQFTYDAFGRRLSKQQGNKIQRYAWRGNLLIHKWEENAADKTLVCENGELRTPIKYNFVTWIYDNSSFTPCGKIADGKTYSIISDYLGTPYLMFDQGGQKTWECQLEIWGRAKITKGTIDDCPFRFQGQYEDAETGLYYNRFRYYSATDGMYLSQDPIGLGGGIELYGYVKDCNIFIDPLGLTEEPEILKSGTVYRTGSATGYNLTPRQLIDPTTGQIRPTNDLTSGLSTDLVKPTKGSYQTIDLAKLQGTGLEAVKDGKTHVSIRPENDPNFTKLTEWANKKGLGTEAEDNYTKAVKKACL